LADKWFASTLILHYCSYFFGIKPSHRMVRYSFQEDSNLVLYRLTLLAPLSLPYFPVAQESSLKKVRNQEQNQRKSSSMCERGCALLLCACSHPFTRCNPLGGGCEGSHCEGACEVATETKIVMFILLIFFMLSTIYIVLCCGKKRGK